MNRGELTFLGSTFGVDFVMTESLVLVAGGVKSLTQGVHVRDLVVLPGAVPDHWNGFSTAQHKTQHSTSQHTPAANSRHHNTACTVRFGFCHD